MKKIIDMLKSMTNSKKKVFALALATCVIVLSIASSSIAYFTDTAKITNTFTSGNVTIELSEAKVVKNDLGHLVKDGENRVTGTEAGVENSYAESSLFPGQKIYKDPTIKNTGNNPAYIGAVITITNDNEVDADADITDILAANKLTSFITGINANATSLIIDAVVTLLRI